MVATPAASDSSTINTGREGFVSLQPSLMQWSHQIMTNRGRASLNMRQEETTEGYSDNELVKQKDSKRE